MKFQYRLTLCLLAGILFAYGPIEFHPLALLFIPLAASKAISDSCRLVAAFAVAANSPSLLLGFDYSENIALATVMFVVPVLLSILIYGMPLGMSGYKSVALLAVLSVVAFIPPISSFNPISIMSIAGLLFPGLGTIGLILFMALLVALSKLSVRLIPVMAVCAIAAGSANASYGNDKKAIGIDTYRGQPDAIQYSSHEMLYRFEEYENAKDAEADVVLFPEAVYREWNSSNAWILKAADKVIYGGARKYIDANRYVNTIVDGKTGEIVYAQKRPIPVEIGDYHKAVSKSDSTIDIANPIPALVCIEIANTWTAFNAFRNRPETLYFVANIGWTKHTWFGGRLESSLKHWARLYGVKVVSAVNYVS